MEIQMSGKLDVLVDSVVAKFMTACGVAVSHESCDGNSLFSATAVAASVWVMTCEVSRSSLAEPCA